jgi:hypothetical protein
LNKRHYQFFALAILIGAPLVVSSLNSLLPKDPSETAMNESAPQQPDYLTPAVDPIAALPVNAMHDPPPMPVNNPPPYSLTGDGMLDPAPTLDPGGVAVGGVDPAMPRAIEVTTPIPAPQAAMTGPAVVEQVVFPPNMRPKFREGPLRP